MARTSTKTIFVLAATAALLIIFYGCGGKKTASGAAATSDGSGGSTAARARVAPQKPTAPAEEPDTSWYDSELTEFRISRAGQLAGLAVLVNSGNRFAGKTVTLTNDLDLSGYSGGAAFNEGKGWIPIGSGIFMFKGVFDGGGRTVSRLYINDPRLTHAGLFGRINEGGVKNLGVLDVNITAGGRTGAVAGGLSNGSAEMCYSTGTVKGKGFVGGAFGHVDKDSKVYGCYSSAAVYGENYVGGLVGDADGGSTVARSYATGNVSGNEAVGGLVGGVLGKGSSVANCYATGTVTCGSIGGGLAGKVIDGGSILNSYATGAVAGRTRVGGIVGQIGGAVANCAALNPSVARAESKGLAGRIGGYGDGKASSGNGALSTMKNSAGAADWAGKGEKGKDGVDITVLQITGDGTIGGRFTEANGWTTMRGMLPGFGAEVRMPEHILKQL